MFNSFGPWLRCMKFCRTRPTLFHSLMYLTLSFPFVGVLYNRVPTDEWDVLGPDGHGPDETAGPNEERGGAQVYPAMSARMWGLECQHRS